MVLLTTALDSPSMIPTHTPTYTIAGLTFLPIRVQCREGTYKYCVCYDETLRKHVLTLIAVRRPRGGPKGRFPNLSRSRCWYRLPVSWWIWHCSMCLSDWRVVYGGRWREGLSYGSILGAGLRYVSSRKTSGWTSTRDAIALGGIVSARISLWTSCILQ